MGLRKLSLLFGFLCFIWVLCYYCEIERIPKIHDFENYERRGPHLIEDKDIETAINITMDRPYNEEVYNSELREKYQLGRNVGGNVEMSICLIVHAKDNSRDEQFAKTLNSVFSQNYSNYTVVYVDDASKDESFKGAKNYAERKALKDKIKFVGNTNDVRRIRVLKQAQKECGGGEYMVVMDGHSRLIGSQVLAILNSFFSRQDGKWFVWSQGLVRRQNVEDGESFAVGASRGYPEEIVKNNGFRSYPLMVGGIQAFKRSLFNRIEVQDLRDSNRNFIRDAEQAAYSIPMLEMAGDRIAYINEVLYFSQSHKRVSEEDMKKARNEIRNKASYKKLISL